MSSSPHSFFLKTTPPSKAELQALLKPLGFRNPSKVWKEWSALAQNPFDRAAWSELLPVLLSEFSKAPDPDLAASQFATYAEQSFHKSQLFHYLHQAPPARRALALVFGLSPALASVLFREPALLYWLFEEDGL